MNFKELLGNLDRGELAGAAVAATAIVGLGWYGKRLWNKRKEEKEKENVGLENLGPEQLLKLAAALNGSGVVSINEARIAKLEDAVEHIRAEVSITAKNASEQKSKDAARLTVLGDELDPLLSVELNKLVDSAIPERKKLLVEALNAIPEALHSLPRSLPEGQITNIRELILFSMMCRNKILGKTACIPRDRASDMIPESLRGVMCILQEEGCYTTEVDSAFTRFFNLLRDDYTFSKAPILQKQA